MVGWVLGGCICGWASKDLFCRHNWHISDESSDSGWLACASLLAILAGRYVREELFHFGVDAVDVEFELFSAHFDGMDT